MGILDDAIREHLELKRQHGADNEDLERLEKEAFGPPSRPGDPEFDTSEGEAAGAPEAEAPEEPEAGVGSEAPTTAQPRAPETGESAGIFDAESGDEEEEDWLSTLEDAVEQPAVGRGGEPQAAEEEQALADESEESAGGPEEMTPTERARRDYSELDDTVDHPAVPEPDSEEGTGERASSPPEAPESAIFDQDDDFADLDLELDIDEAEEEEGSGDFEAAAEPEPTSTEMDTVPERGGTDEFDADEEEEDELEDEDEDLLNETPDFLQDAPEGERLWFEQGEPKDFDFDDDED